MKYFIWTFGCQMNEYDSEILAGLMSEAGFEKSELEESDIVIVNSCAVREKPERKILEISKQLKGKIRVLTGCVAQVYKEKLKNYYDIVVSTFELAKIPTYILNFLNKKTFEQYWSEYNLNFIEDKRALKKHKHKAFLSIMRGCNNFCSYCIVPFAKGREFSKPLNQVVDEVKRLIDSGFKEITLLGQNVTSYGKYDGVSFLNLLEKLEKIEGDFVIKFTTSHPRDTKKELIEFVLSSKKIGKWFHLPLQSGSNKVLNLMNRGYSVEEYMELVELIRTNKEATITTDLMVGFPGESEEDFKETLKIVEQVNYDAAFTFFYTPRPGTFAANMKGLLPQKERKARLSILIDLIQKIAANSGNKFLGLNLKGFVESKAKKGGFQIRLDNNKIAIIEEENLNIGDVVKVNITDNLGWTLKGKLI